MSSTAWCWSGCICTFCTCKILKLAELLHIMCSIPTDTRQTQPHSQCADVTCIQQRPVLAVYGFVLRCERLAQPCPPLANQSCCCRGLPLQDTSSFSTAPGTQHLGLKEGDCPQRRWFLNLHTLSHNADTIMLQRYCAKIRLPPWQSLVSEKADTNIFERNR